MHHSFRHIKFGSQQFFARSSLISVMTLFVIKFVGIDARKNELLHLWIATPMSGGSGIAFRSV